MKKMIFTILLVGLFSTVDARTIKVNRSKEVSNDEDYNSVKEEHKDKGWFSRAKSTLDCHGTGGVKCNWKIHPSSLPDLVTGSGNPVPIDDLKDYADNEIGANNLSDSYINNIVIDGELWYRSVTWNSNTVNPNFNSLISITVNPAITP